jgi:Bacterial Ig-like domain
MKHYESVSGWVGVLVLGAVAVASGCGNEFDDKDCKVTRTCAADDDGGKGEGGAPVESPPVTNAGSPEAGDGPGRGSVGGDGGTGASGGGSSAPACKEDNDCSNADPNDGVEACVDGACTPGNAPPRVTKITPKNDDAIVEPDAIITLELSEALAPESVTTETVQLLDGGVTVPGQLRYEDGVITIQPTLPLRRRAEYAVKLTKEVVDLEGTGLLNEFESHFAVRDGSWHAIDAVRGDMLELASGLPLLPDGSALLAWAGADGNDCPVSAGWVSLGAFTATKEAFAAGTAACSGVLTAAGGGSASVAWRGDNAWYVQQQRGGAWLADAQKVIDAPQPRLQTLAVSPQGVLTRFEYNDRGGILFARQTDANGAWESQSRQLSSGHFVSDPVAAFDASGRGLAAWSKTEDSTSVTRIVASRFTGGSWAEAKDVPGSLTALGDADDLRSAPGLAVRPSGEAMAVWRAGAAGAGTLQASYFLPDTEWELAVLASGATELSVINAAPAVTFDGERFVAAWLGTSAAKVNAVFTATFDPKKGWSEPVEHDAKKTLPILEQPRLVSDGHGSLVLVWRTGKAPNYTLVYRRFVDGAWSDIETLPGGTITDGRTYGVRGPALSMNESGVIALSWANYNESDRLTTIRLATFH